MNKKFGAIFLALLLNFQFATPRMPSIFESLKSFAISKKVFKSWFNPKTTKGQLTITGSSLVGLFFFLFIYKTFFANGKWVQKDEKNSNDAKLNEIRDILERDTGGIFDEALVKVTSEHPLFQDVDPGSKNQVEADDPIVITVAESGNLLGIIKEKAKIGQKDGIADEDIKKTIIDALAEKSNKELNKLREEKRELGKTGENKRDKTGDQESEKTTKMLFDRHSNTINMKFSKLIVDLNNNNVDEKAAELVKFLRDNRIVEDYKYIISLFMADNTDKKALPHLIQQFNNLLQKRVPREEKIEISNYFSEVTKLQKSVGQKKFKRFHQRSLTANVDLLKSTNEARNRLTSILESDDPIKEKINRLDPEKFRHLIIKKVNFDQIFEKYELTEASLNLIIAVLELEKEDKESYFEHLLYILSKSEEKNTSNLSEKLMVIFEEKINVNNFSKVIKILNKKQKISQKISELMLRKAYELNNHLFIIATLTIFKKSLPKKEVLLEVALEMINKNQNAFLSALLTSDECKNLLKENKIDLIKATIKKENLKDFINLFIGKEFCCHEDILEIFYNPENTNLQNKTEIISFLKEKFFSNIVARWKSGKLTLDEAIEKLINSLKKRKKFLKLKILKIF